MSKFSITVLLLLLLLILGGLVFFAKNYDSLLVSPSPSVSATVPATPTPISDLIQMDFPQSGDLVESPLLIYGQARGSWFFEGSFPVKLLDADGKEIVTGTASADDEWMTEELVPFKAELKFKVPMSVNGMLILQKDNPSGDSANDAVLKIPVEF